MHHGTYDGNDALSLGIQCFGVRYSAGALATARIVSTSNRGNYNQAHGSLGLPVLFGHTLVIDQQYSGNSDELQ
jgi:hypothetical protein